MLAPALFMLPYQAPAAGLVLDQGPAAFDSRTLLEKGVVDTAICCWEDLARTQKEALAPNVSLLHVAATRKRKNWEMSRKKEGGESHRPY